MLNVVETLKTVTRIPQMYATMTTSSNKSNRHHLDVTQGAERNPVNYGHVITGYILSIKFILNIGQKFYALDL